MTTIMPIPTIMTMITAIPMITTMTMITAMVIPTITARWERSTTPPSATPG